MERSKWVCMAARRHTDLQQFASTKQFDMPTTIADYRKLKNQRGLDAQEFLKQPGFALLKDQVHVENTETELSEVPGHKFPIRIYSPARQVDGNRGQVAGHAILPRRILVLGHS